MFWRALPALALFCLLPLCSAHAADRYAQAAGKLDNTKVQELERNINALNQQLRALEREAAELRGQAGRADGVVQPARTMPPAATQQSQESAAARALNEEKLKEESAGSGRAQAASQDPPKVTQQNAPSSPAQPPVAAAPPIMREGKAVPREESRAMAENKWNAASQALFPALPVQTPLPEAGFRPEPGSLSQGASAPQGKDFSAPAPSPTTRAMAASPEYFPPDPKPGDAPRHTPPTTGPTRTSPAPEPQGRVVQPEPQGRVVQPEPQGRVVQPVATQPPAASAVSSQQVYDQALALYQARRFKDSETAFKAFLERWPQSKLAPNAYYWLGETYYGRGDYSNAIFAFKDVQSRYPKSAKVPDSLLKTAMSYARLGDEANAALHVAVLYEDWPASAAARQAKAKGLKAL